VKEVHVSSKADDALVMPPIDAAASGERKFSPLTLTAMVVGSMVGAGIFSLPATFGRATGPFGALIAWVIAGGGMLMLAFVFQALAQRKPDLDAGIFAYAKAGFGNYLGFAAAFGFWFGTCLGNITYFILIMSTLGRFFPAFGNGNTLVATMLSSVILWSVHSMILRGVKEAATVNTIVTIAKVVPIAIFIIFMIIFFDPGKFTANFWGGDAYSLGDVFGQVRSTMLVTVFVFIGIEGASVYSRYARRREDVGTATVLGFLGVLCLLVMVTLLPYGMLDRAQLAAMRQPSMAGVLEAAVGTWGSIFISLGLLVSVLGAYLAWSLLAAEVLFMAAKDGVVPKALAKENTNQVPSACLWLTNIIVQLLLILIMFAREAFNLALALTSAKTLIPYVLSAGFALKLAHSGQTYESRPQDRRGDLICAALATVYTVFMLFAGGLKYVLLSAIFFAPGSALFILARREQRATLFTSPEWILFLAVIAAAVYGIYGLAIGMITI
jgi:arginine:ornithine antiporter / lysine permease